MRGLIDFVSSHGGNRGGSGRQSEPVHGSHGIKYKTSLCRDLLRGGCPRGANCTFAHSEDELDKYRSRHRKNSGKTRNGGDGLYGSQENLIIDAAAVADPSDPSAAAFYFNGSSTATPSTQTGGGAASRTVFLPGSYSFRNHNQYAPSAYPTPPPLPPNVYGASGPVPGPGPGPVPGPGPGPVPGPETGPTGGGGGLAPQPEYGMPAPISMTNYRPMETARLIPSLANQSLVVLQNRKQEILDQLEKIAAVTSTTNQQVLIIH